ncbi:MAG: glutamate synthase large subunit [Spirochaetaceae bacterium]|jgi:glutamate synthase (NADPH/NADH) large chain|nr:glutamate synthase large subunit [Spirochaetaceae bacterium]
MDQQGRRPERRAARRPALRAAKWTHGRGGEGLYAGQNEHDSCGIGFVADIQGRPSHDILRRGLEVLERMEHRGAESADNKTGDGSGVLLQIPHGYYKTLIPGLPDRGKYGTGLMFLPAAPKERLAVDGALEKTAAALGLEILARRPLELDSAALGPMAAGVEPYIEQLVLTAPDTENLEAALYIFRKTLEKLFREQGGGETSGAVSWYMPSLSSATIVYKGMLMPNQLRRYYRELDNGAMETAVAMVHSRFSTNTFPDWPLAQPFRLVSHNGEINTITGNRFWMSAREALFSTEGMFAETRLGRALAKVLPVIEPGRSDSASLDNALELLVMAGRSLPHALMMLIPESWNDKNPISDELKAFYEYHACFMEPWDGPASIVFCDGRYVGGTLDRNGLRPSRYTITKDGLIVMASETGVQDFKSEEVEYKGRLLPGKLLVVDMAEGRIIPDEEVKEQICLSKPYAGWVRKNIVVLDQGAPGGAVSGDVVSGGAASGEAASGEAASADVVSGGAPGFVSPAEGELLFMERSAGYTREDRDRLLLPMAETAQEPTSSMGTDTPLAVFSDKPQRVYAYFKQVFAQVTNPPIDSIREDLVMTLTSFVGPQKNLLDETEEHCRRVKVLNPIMTGEDLNRLRALPGFSSRVLDAVFTGDDSLKAALSGFTGKVLDAARGGGSFLILSDRAALDPRRGFCSIPALLAAGAAHHALIAAGLRMKVSLIVESAEPREPMHFALLFGYGADLVVPYGALASLEALCREKHAGDFGHARKNYIKGLNKAMLKVMSKMGTSTLRSYRGAQVFEAVGLAGEVMEMCFRGTASRIGGAGFAELEAEALAQYRFALAEWERQREPAGPETLLEGQGQYRWRKYGERHAWNPETIYLLQWAARTGDYEKFKQFSAAVNALNQSPHVIRGLIDFAPPGTIPGGPAAPVPLDEVEGEEEIMKRFTTGAMSFGSISKEAHETIAAAMNSIKGRSNSGEGGESPDRFPVQSDGRWLRSAIKQVASARFGVTSEYLANAVELQIKIAQGAKPGEGGQLPGHKVDGLIAKTRHSTPGVTLISPPPHHDIYSIEDLAELIFDLKNANPQARISVKLVSETGIGTIAAGVAKAHADNILISGYDGGTGASPQSSIRHAGLPWELGLSETHQVLVRNGLRGRVRLQTDGQLKTGRDIVIAGMLGAEEFGFGTSTLIVMGCVMMRKCHENTCPMGVATQDPELRRRFTGKSEYLVHFFRFLAREVREIMAALGFKKFDDLVGRADLLVQRKSQKQKSANIDLSAVLYRTKGPEGIPGGKAIRNTMDQIHKIRNVLDRTLIEKCADSLDKKRPSSFSMPVKNTDRAVGAMLSWELSRRFGGYGLPENFITLDFTGSAGQSFGAFLTQGISFRLAGDANDYLGKGLSGGRIAVAPPEGSRFKSNENIILGNTVLYGATSGELYAAGIAGERFCVRNSGATAVVEGTGDHCAEYMTGGRLVVLGRVGRNFAAGMSGGVAYVLDCDGRFEYFLNSGMVELSGLDNEEDERFVKDTISKHVYWTGSVHARTILDNWARYKPKFVMILPVEYKRALQQMKLAELDRKLYEIREREELEVKN